MPKSASIHTYQILLSSNRLKLFLLSFTHVLNKIETTMSWNCIFKSALFSTDNGRTSRLSSFYRIIVNHKNFIPKYLDNTFKFLLNFSNIEAATGGKSTSERFWKNSSKCREIRLQVNSVMASFRSYDNSDVIVTLTITKIISLSNTALVVIFLNPC